MYTLTNTTLMETGKYEVKKLRKLNILLVEDNPLNSKLVSLLFLQNGLQLQTAVNGAEAINKINATDFDIVLMDMEMPVMNGYQATNLIRHELKNNIPIIAITAHTRKEEKEKCMQLGMNDYIEKPINETLLFRSILNLTGGKKRVTVRKSIAGSAQTAVNPGKICNLDYLNKVTHGNKKSLNSILDVLLEETPEEISILDAAIENTNYVLISDVSHKMRASFSMLGVSSLNPILEEMQHLGSAASGIKRIALLNRRVHNVFIKAMKEMKEETGRV